jgi:hypothetical protein
MPFWMRLRSGWNRAAIARVEITTASAGWRPISEVKAAWSSTTLPAFSTSPPVSSGKKTRTTIWTESSTYGEKIVYLSGTGCSDCQAYRLTPSVYTTVGTNNGDSSYRYLVQDYYVNVKEWTWNNAARQWEMVRESGWTPFENATGLEVTQDSQGQYARYGWQLDFTEGAHYLGVWVADRYGRVSSLK